MPENFNWRASRYVGNVAIIGAGRAFRTSGDVKSMIEGSAQRSSAGVEMRQPADVQRPVVCLECGFRSRTLRRHLRIQHGLERAAYYARWNLPPDHPITAPAYSARRSALAKELGLGRGRESPSAEPEPATSAKPRRRSRSKAEVAPSA